MAVVGLRVMEGIATMKRDRETMDAAMRQARENLVALREKGERISDEGDFIAREIQQFFMDAEKSGKRRG